MIHLYKYVRTIPIFRNVSNEGLENTSTMFNDTITLHRNVNNVLKFKLTDRDRRTVNIGNQNIKVNIVDDATTLIVDTFYLSPTENTKIFEVTLPKTFVNQLLPRRDYSFTVTIVDAHGEEEALYIDHDFMMGGSITVYDNYSEIDAEKYEGYVQRVDAHEKDVDGEYVLEDYIEVDEDFVKVELLSYDSINDPEITVKLQKFREKYYPVRVNEELQWKDYIEVHNTNSHVWSNIELPKGKYRLVLLTQDPSPYFMVYHKINKL